VLKPIGRARGGDTSMEVRGGVRHLSALHLQRAFAYKLRDRAIQIRPLINERICKVNKIFVIININIRHSGGLRQI
jgi:hypothetical protein